MKKKFIPRQEGPVKLKSEDTCQEYQQVTFIYFLDSGNFWCNGVGKYDPKLLHDCFSAREVGRKLNGLKMLPVIEGGCWNKPFVCVTDHPELVLPDED
jgi:hypothetical protein